MPYDIETLSGIKQVVTPSHLYPKIRQRIDALKDSYFAPPVAWSLLAAAMLVLMINVWVIIQSKDIITRSVEANMQQQVFNLYTNNDIYGQ